MTSLGPGPEFDKIRRMIKAPGHSEAHIGDDAALLEVAIGEKLVVSTDTSVENVHFRREWMTFEEIGYRATAAALSDLAAMAAVPIGILVAYGVRPSDSGAMEDLARGAGSAAAASGTVIVGGDVSSSELLSVTATVLGTAARPLLRSGARPGDLIYLTGTLGGSRLALNHLQRGETPSAVARDRFVRPVPRIKEALWLAKAGATACIDISDGLAGELWHLATASCVELDTSLHNVPVFEGMKLQEALLSGEEYELCVTMPHEVNAQEFEARFGIPLSLIGNVVASPEPRVNFNISVMLRSSESFNHFRNDQ